MMTMVMLLLTAGVCGWVIYPLLRSSGAESAEADVPLHELSHELIRLGRSLEELRFDLETDRLSAEEYARLAAELERRREGLLSRLVEKGKADAAHDKGPARRCPSCGKKVSRSDRFCSACGTALR